MFDTIRLQMTTIEEFLRTLGYDEVSVLSFTFKPSVVSITIVCCDTFQATVPDIHQHGQYYYSGISADDLSGIWTKLYALPSRATRELTVLANQLSGIAGMESELRNVRVQQMLGPILESREEMKKLLMAPVEVLEPVAAHLDDEVPF